MELLTISIMALALSADAVAVSLTSGLMIRNIKVNKALKIALFFGVFQGIMPLIGWFLGLTFRDFLSAFAPWIAFILLSGIGSKMIYESLEKEGELDKFNPLDNQTLTGLAIATSIDALAAGLGLAVLKGSILAACSLIAGITFILCFIAVWLGHRFGNLCGQKLGIVGGTVLILIGGKILLFP
jgi:putative Mn2+ efflux pump MntP